MQEKNAHSYDMRFGDRLKVCLKAKRISQKNAAKSLGIGENTLLNYIKNRRIPDALLALSIARMCDASLEWLISGENNAKIAYLWSDIVEKEGRSIESVAEELQLSEGYVVAVVDGRLVPSMQVVNDFYSRFDVIPPAAMPKSNAHEELVCIDTEKQKDDEIDCLKRKISMLEGRVVAHKEDVERLTAALERLANK
jgi:transcriptional regulator with XRE-family HTH domain